MPDETPALGRWLKERRQALGLSREALADRVHCALSTIEKIERGDRRPSVEIATALATALGLPLADQPAFIEWARGRPSGYLAGLPPAPAGRGPLPVPLTPLIGRAALLDEVATLLADPAVRLLTLVGPPGIGKTRLGLALAATLRPAFAGGVAWVALAALHDPALLPATIAAALGLKEAAERPLLATLGDHLRDQALLLVLDNFEQIAPAAPMLATLLEGAPGLRMIVTSRAPLHLYGEYEYAVPPLALPDLAALPAAATLAQNPAVALFTQRAVAANARFRLTGENAAAVAELCVRLEGLPLALELAAARSKRYPPAALLRQMTRRLPLLVGGPGERSPRQQTMRGAIAWSYDLLPAPAQGVFRALGVFVGGGTAAAVAAVLNDGDADEAAITAILEDLVDQSLVRSELEGDSLRFGMLELIREYADEQLAATGEAEVGRARHAAYYLALAEEAAPELKGSQQQEWLNRLEADHDNLRAALDWLLAAGEREQAGRLNVALWRFWLLHGHLREGSRRLAELLAVGSDLSASVRAQALNGGAIMVWTQGDVGQAEALLRESLTLSRALGDEQGVGVATMNLAAAYGEQGRYDEAEAAYAESLALWRAQDDRWHLALILSNMAELAIQQDAYARGAALATESLAIQQALGDTAGSILSLLNQGTAALHQGDTRTARARYNAALAASRAMGDTHITALGLLCLGLLALAEDDPASAQPYYAESLALFHAVGDRRALARVLIGCARVAVVSGQAGQAARLLGAATELHPALATLLAAERAGYEQALVTAQVRLGAGAFAAAWEDGQALPLEQAVALAQAALGAEPLHK